MIKDIFIAFLIVGMFALALSMFGFIFVQSSEVAYYAIY